MIQGRGQAVLETPVKISISDFGARPDSGEDASVAIRLALQAAARIEGPTIIDIPKGSYELHAEHAVRIPYYISNTASEIEVPHMMKTIGIYLDRLHHVTIEGNDSLLLYHGKQTLFALESCSDITIQNLHFDYAQPTMAEMTVTHVGEDYIDLQVHEESQYEISDGQLWWVGPDWRFHYGYMQEYDPLTDTTWRTHNWCERAERVEELDQHQLRLYFVEAPSTVVGRTWQVRDGIRDQVGVFMHHSRQIRWYNAHFHYMHGLGVVSQFSEDLEFDSLTFEPRSETRRTAASFADLMHFSGCRGLIRIEHSQFVGCSHDDAINVHGTHVFIEDAPQANQVIVQFMHHQTYGIDGFFPGDQIHFLRERTLAVYSNNVVTAVQRLSSRKLLLTLQDAVPDDRELGDVIENSSWNPDVLIRHNVFRRIPSRCILVTTSGEVTIEDNDFIRNGMSAILIANDASSWFESGRCENVTIRRNRFQECGGPEHPVIYILPENKVIDPNEPVHQHIHIVDNEFKLTDSVLLYAKSTLDLRFSNNKVCKGAVLPINNILRLDGGNELENAEEQNTLIHLAGCRAVTIVDNQLNDDGVNRNIRTVYMKEQELMNDPSLTVFMQ